MTENTSREKYRKIRILLRVLIVVSIIFAWGHSLLPAEESSEESGFVLEQLKPILSVFLPEDMITGLFIRKLAHFCEYAIMGLEMAAYTALIIRKRRVFTKESEKADRKEILKLSINTLFCGLAVAFIDETIQIFSPGRGPEIADVWLDMSGFVSGGIVVALVYMIIDRKRKNSKRML